MLATPVGAVVLAQALSTATAAAKLESFRALKVGAGLLFELRGLERLVNIRTSLARCERGDQAARSRPMHTFQVQIACGGAKAATVSCRLRVVNGCRFGIATGKY